MRTEYVSGTTLGLFIGSAVGLAYYVWYRHQQALEQWRAEVAAQRAQGPSKRFAQVFFESAGGREAAGQVLEWAGESLEGRA
jgi:hypothetical protein